MRAQPLFGIASIVLLTSGLFPVTAQPPAGDAAQATTPAPAQPPAQPAAPQQAQPISPPAVKVPDGFTPLFNGKDLTGWHVSKTNHHGITPDYQVMQGVIVGTQRPLGQGGILLTDKKFKNFEVFIEVRPDWGCDSGLFLRSSEAGEAYQVTLDFLPNGGMGGIYGERLQGVGGRGRRAGAAGQAGAQAAGGQRAAGAAGQAPAGARGAAPAGPPPGFGEGNQANAAWVKAWKRDDWNTVRARIEGDVPHITVWINDQQITDFTDTENHAAKGATDGHIAIQIHGGTRWVQGGFWRWRNIAVKELPGS